MEKNTVLITIEDGIIQEIHSDLENLNIEILDEDFLDDEMPEQMKKTKREKENFDKIC